MVRLFVQPRKQSDKFVDISLQEANPLEADNILHRESIRSGPRRQDNRKRQCDKGKGESERTWRLFWVQSERRRDKEATLQDKLKGIR